MTTQVKEVYSRKVKSNAIINMLKEIQQKAGSKYSQLEASGGEIIINVPPEVCFIQEHPGYKWGLSHVERKKEKFLFWKYERVIVGKIYIYIRGNYDFDEITFNFYDKELCDIARGIIPEYSLKYNFSFVIVKCFDD